MSTKPGADQIFNFFSTDMTKSNPYYRPWDRIKNTEYELYGQEFVNVDNEEEALETIIRINNKIKNCNILINSSKNNRIIALTLSSALQPLHLIFGYILLNLICILIRGMWLKVRKIFYKR